MCLPKEELKTRVHSRTKAPQGDRSLGLRCQHAPGMWEVLGSTPCLVKEENRIGMLPTYISAAQEAEEGRSQPRGHVGLPSENTGKQCGDTMQLACLQETTHRWAINYRWRRGGRWGEGRGSRGRGERGEGGGREEKEINVLSFLRSLSISV